MDHMRIFIKMLRMLPDDLLGVLSGVHRRVFSPGVLVPLAMMLLLIGLHTWVQGLLDWTPEKLQTFPWCRQHQAGILCYLAYRASNARHVLKHQERWSNVRSYQLERFGTWAQVEHQVCRELHSASLLCARYKTGFPNKHGSRS